MSDTQSTRIKFGLTNVARELDLEVESAEAVVSEFEDALSGDQKLLWVSAMNGRRHGLVVDKIVYIEVEAQEEQRGIGFRS